MALLTSAVIIQIEVKIVDLLVISVKRGLWVRPVQSSNCEIWGWGGGEILWEDDNFRGE
jgi:hypothetical protein